MRTFSDHLCILLKHDPLALLIHITLYSFLQSKSLYSVKIQKNKNQNNSIFRYFLHSCSCKGFSFSQFGESINTSNFYQRAEFRTASNIRNRTFQTIFSANSFLSAVNYFRKKLQECKFGRVLNKPLCCYEMCLRNSSNCTF